MLLSTKKRSKCCFQAQFQNADEDSSLVPMLTWTKKKVPMLTRKKKKLPMLFSSIKVHIFV